jgi:hypothetical protein
VIVFLDANLLMQDPMFTGVMWQVVAHAPEEWQLRLVTSEVAIAEAAAGFGRNVTEEVAALDKLTKRWSRIDAQDDVEALRRALKEKTATYRSYLVDALLATGVEVLAPPAAPHMQLVERAATRRRPCDKNGDGYRDTLYWLTVLELAEANPGEQIVLVTRDSDFMNEDKSEFHSDLIEDLEAISAVSRVKLAQLLDDVVLELAKRSPEEANLKSLRSELQEETVRQYVTSLFEAVLETELDPQLCALPRRSLKSVLQSLGPVQDLKYEVRGGVGEGKAVADFNFRANASIVLTLPEGVDAEGPESMSRIAESSGQVVYVLVKPLLFSGIMQLGRYGRPVGGRISRIAALPDDPGRRAWRAQAGSSLMAANMPEMLGRLNLNPLADYLKSVDIAGQVLKNVNLNPLADYLKSVDIAGQVLKNVNLNPLADYLKSVDIAGQVLKNFGGNVSEAEYSDEEGREDAEPQSNDDSGEDGQEPRGDADDGKPSS